MSKEAVQAIIGKAVVDTQFRESLFADPDQVLSEFELTEEEVAALKAIDTEAMESFVGTLDERISKALIAGFDGDSSGGGQVRWLDPGMSDRPYLWPILPT